MVQAPRWTGARVQFPHFPTVSANCGLRREHLNAFIGSSVSEVTDGNQVVFYSMYGHVYRLAEAVSAGAREVAGTEVSVYQMLVPDDILDKSGAKAARTAPCAGYKVREACRC
jgi:hypothetical protein